MNEQRPEKQPKQSPLALLDNEFEQPNRTYGELIVAFDNYIRSDLQLNSIGSDAMLRDMMQNGIFPGMDLFAYNYQLGIEQFRMAIWRYFVPLAEGVKTDEELDIWVPQALETTLPKNSRHLPDRCYRFMQAVPGYCLYGSCPVKNIESTIEHSMQTPDFSALEYTINPVKTMRNHRRRLLAATRRHIFEPEYAINLELCYEALCEETFGGGI